MAEPNISKEVWVEDLEKLPDGSFKKKNHIAKAKNGTTFDEHLADYMYQIPNIVGTQVCINRLSDTNRLFFKLENDLTGNITISLDNGVTEKPLNDFEGVQLTELEKGFVEVVADATFFTLRNRSGLSKSDRLALIDIVNVAEENQTFIKTDIVNKINEVDSGDKFELLAPNSPWIDIQSAIPLISTGKKWASGFSQSIPNVEFENESGVGGYKSYAIDFNNSEIPFVPSLIILNINNSTTPSPLSIWSFENLFDGGSRFANANVGSKFYRAPYKEGIMKVPSPSGEVVWIAIE